MRNNKGRTASMTEIASNTIMSVPRAVGKYYLSSFFNGFRVFDGADARKDLRSQSFGGVVMSFMTVTVAFLGFLIYIGAYDSTFLRSIPGLGTFLAMVGSHGAVNILVSFIIMLIILPLPFRVLGAAWVSFSTAQPSIAVPKDLLEDIACALQRDGLGSETTARLLLLLRDNNVERCRNRLSVVCASSRSLERKGDSTYKAESWWSFIALQVILAISALLVCVMSKELIPDHGLTSAAAGGTSIVFLCLAIVATHGVGGRLRYEDFDFYQPFSGGVMFCVLQGISWTLFSVSVFVIGLQSFCSVMASLQMTCFKCLERRLLVSSLGVDEGYIIASASSIGLVAEIFMVISLFAFRTKARDTDDAQKRRDLKVAQNRSSVGPTATTPYRRENPLWTVLVVTAWTLLFIKPEMIFFVCFYSTMTLVPHVLNVDQNIVNLIWIAASCGYAYTYVGDPSGTGRREWPAYKKWIQEYVFDPMFEPYFGMRLLRDTKKPFGMDNNEKYIFGYHPHAVIPLAAGWCSHTSQWNDQLPGIKPSVLTSSILHNIPIARDVIQWSGGRDVSRKSFSNALRTVGSVLLIPGGQREMIGSSSASKAICINVKHKGFIRLGLEHGASLVPVYNFGGHRTFDNIPFPHSWQRWCMSALRANILFLPYGNWLFVPRTGPLTIVVGAPLRKVCDATPTEEQVTLMHRRYYTSLRELFEKYKDVAGFSDSTMTFSDTNFKTLRADEFERLWKRACDNAASSQVPTKKRIRSKQVMNEGIMATSIVVLLFIASWLLSSS